MNYRIESVFELLQKSYRQHLPFGRNTSTADRSFTKTNSCKYSYVAALMRVWSYVFQFIILHLGEKEVSMNFVEPEKNPRHLTKLTMLSLILQQEKVQTSFVFTHILPMVRNTKTRQCSYSSCRQTKEQYILSTPFLFLYQICRFFTARYTQCYIKLHREFLRRLVNFN